MSLRELAVIEHGTSGAVDRTAPDFLLREIHSEDR
jgi:hypothetical protein